MLPGSAWAVKRVSVALLQDWGRFDEGIFAILFCYGLRIASQMIKETISLSSLSILPGILQLEQGQSVIFVAGSSFVRINMRSLKSLPTIQITIRVANAIAAMMFAWRKLQMYFARYFDARATKPLEFAGVS